MANFTQSIREILQFNKQPAESLENVSDVYAVANRCLFDKAPMNVLESSYRERFITGFTLHFFNEEIGLETLPLWKIALNEKLFNNASYINLIFENLDKQIFADYNVKQSSTYGTNSGSKTANGSLSSQRDIGTLTSEESSDALMETDGTESTDTLLGTGTVENAIEGSELRYKAGEDTLTKAGSETRIKDGEDVLKKEGAEVRHKGGKDTTSMLGSEETANSGTDTTTDDGNQRTIHSGASVNTQNGLAVQYDTPMGSVQNMRSPGGPVEPTYTVEESTGDLNWQQYEGNSGISQGHNGTGYSYLEGQDFDYMTAATENGTTGTTVDNNNENLFHSNTLELEHGLTTTRSFDDRADETEYNSKEDIVYGVDNAGTANERKDTTEYGGKEELAYGKDVNGNTSARTDTTEYGGKEVVSYGKALDNQGAPIADARLNTETRDTSDERTISSTTDKSLSDLTSKSSTSATDDDLVQMTEDTETTSESHADTENGTDYSLNLEMLYRSMPLLNKVWELFDDLFMQIF